MHVTDEMNEELERLLGLVLGPPSQDRRDVVDGVENVGEVFALPTVWARKETVAGWKIANATDVMQRRGPPSVEADLVGPGGHAREVAWRRVWETLRVPVERIGPEDGADGVEDIWVEV